MEPSARIRALVLAVLASAAVIAITVGFANVTSTSRVIDHAEELHLVNSTLGTAAIARAAAGQVALFQDLSRRDLASTGTLETAERELALAHSALRDLAGDLPPGVAPDVEALLDALSAQPLDLPTVEARYEPAAEVLGDRISFIESEIGRSERVGNYWAAGLRLAVILVIPTAAILIYRRRAAEQLNAERLRMEAQLEAERAISRAKDLFVAGMSHEIRTPLTGICGFSEMLLDASPEGSSDQETISHIHSEASELRRMVDDFIAASRVEGKTLEIEPAPVGLVEVVTSVVDGFRRRGVTITVEGADPVAWCDRGRTQQIITNLVSNAVRHGGPNISVTTSQEGTDVRCFVIDDGAGMAPEIHDRLFTRFIYDGEEAITTGSLGLGTWVARELARAMGGDVTHDRVQDRTIFTLSLPAALDAEQGTARMAEAAV